MRGFDELVAVAVAADVDLRTCPRWVPGSDPAAHDATLRALHAELTASGPFVPRASRHVLELRKPA